MCNSIWLRASENLDSMVSQFRPHESKLTLQDTMLNLIAELSANSTPLLQLGSYAIEASWVTNRWEKLTEYTKALTGATPSATEDFNIGIGDALRALYEDNETEFQHRVESLLIESTRPLTLTTTTTLQGCHASMLQLHVLFELEMIAGRRRLPYSKPDLVSIMDDRLDMLGTFPSDQKYLLGVRRAAMQLARQVQGDWFSHKVLICLLVVQASGICRCLDPPTYLLRC